jgi:hypothetical protein
MPSWRQEDPNATVELSAADVVDHNMLARARKYHMVAPSFATPSRSDLIFMLHEADVKAYMTAMKFRVNVFC